MTLAGGVWSIIRMLKVDELIALKTSDQSVWRRFIPHPKAYRPEQFEYQVSPSLKVLLDRHDYSQWRIFAGGLRINSRIFEYFVVRPFSFTMIDVGANVGGYSILLSKEIDVENFHIHMFEPNPEISNTLAENVRRWNRAELTVRPHVNFTAAGDVTGRLPMRIDEQHSGMSTLAKAKRPFTKTVDVNVITLDQYVKDKGLEDLDFIKVRAEAYEPAVLKGAIESITHFKPTLYFQYSREWFDNFSVNYISALFTYLNSLGYFFLREDKEGKMHYFVLNEKTLKEFRQLTILGVIRYEQRKYK